ncbi:MAG: carotenoid 1,2-hydratase [Chitinophagales bacterium]|nr:carotenoid 1,2-hydratase [Chitinophagales bacterium]
MKTLHSNFVRPTDWPTDGEIDLSIHDLPHQSSTTEWWYINAHILGADGKEYSIFASFFRRLLSINEKTNEPDYAHSITWAIIDVKKKKYYHNSLVDKRTPKIGLEKLKKGELLKDERLRKAAIEMLEKDVVPYPDRLFKKGANTKLNKLHLQYDNNEFVKLDNGNYLLKLEDEEHEVEVQMEFKPQKPAIRHGENGVVFGVTSEDMFYYFIPRNDAKGFIKIKE